MALHRFGATMHAVGSQVATISPQSPQRTSVAPVVAVGVCVCLGGCVVHASSKRRESIGTGAKKMVRFFWRSCRLT